MHKPLSAVLSLLFFVAAAPAAEPNLYAQHAREVTEHIQKNFFDPQSGVYFKSMTLRRPDYVWLQSVMFSNLVAAARSDPSGYGPILDKYFTALNGYWDAKVKIPGYEAAPTHGNGNDKYYDDNAWLVITFLEAYDANHDPRYLTRAEETLHFVLSGWDEEAGGGIWWHQGHKAGTKNACSNGPAAVGCLRLAQYRKKDAAALVDQARKIVAWTVKTLQADDGLFEDRVVVASGEVKRGKLTYNSALMLQALLGLYQADGKKEDLEQAERIAHAADRFLDRRTGVYRDAVRYSHFMVEADLELYRVTKEDYLLKRAKRNVDAFYENWKAKAPDDMISNAAVARVLWLMAETEKNIQLPSSAQVVPQSERLSPYGLAKPVLIVAGDLPKDFENKDDAAVLHTDKDAPPAGFQFLRIADEQPASGKVGVYIPAHAVFSLKGRVLSNKGDGVVTLGLAKSARRETRTIELRGNKIADYNELCRCAVERAAGSPWPPKQPGEPTVPKGTLVIVGGGGMTADIAKAFIKNGGGPDGNYVVLPISMPDPIDARAEEGFLRRMGAKNITVIPYREQKDLESPKNLEAIKKATGLWFGGGRQWNFMDAYEGTQLPALFKDVLARGGVIGGSSAGATIQGDYMLRGAPAGPYIMMSEGYERALGFLPGTAIDQHFSARNRFGDMTAFMKRYPQFLGIGLDEATAIVVQGSTAEVMGKGKVYFYDGKKKVKEGRADFEAFPAGTKYDLKERRVIP